MTEQVENELHRGSIMGNNSEQLTQTTVSKIRRGKIRAAGDP